MVLVVGVAVASAALAAEPVKLTDASFLDVDAQLKAAEGRPNEVSRLSGLKAYLSRDYSGARTQFERAAYYADKYSQHYLSLMYWHGSGVPLDRVQAYIWADLAAERGSRQMLLIREKMWSDLTPAQQAQAAEQGLALYDRYGDGVAKPRAEGAMRRFADDMTGSRAGYDGQMLATSGKPVSGQFFAKTGSNASSFTQTAVGTREQLYGAAGRGMSRYWAEQDRLLEGKVRVGPVVPVRKDRSD
ncbi:SEL1-like repeat protein [Aerolutibacter daejeonensis]|uniref:SEL1-like repeat protein n=1 Tax=Aerolutibacter daejeonensis TaxID=346181 RepID=UPI000A751B40|nr:SEL1-like repeat protein [Lysobacter daejeonensis]